MDTMEEKYSKYNKIMSVYNDCHAEFERVSEEAFKEAEAKSHRAFRALCKEIEDQVKDWTPDDLADVLKICQNEHGMGGADRNRIGMILAAYGKVHIGGRRDDNPANLMDLLNGAREGIVIIGVDPPEVE